jgi:hypothetical protein
MTCEWRHGQAVAVRGVSGRIAALYYMPAPKAALVKTMGAGLMLVRIEELRADEVHDASRVPADEVRAASAVGAATDADSSVRLVPADAAPHAEGAVSGCPSGKRQHRSYHEAVRQTAKFARGRGQRVEAYRCEVCCAWHLGRRDPIRRCR